MSTTSHSGEPLLILDLDETLIYGADRALQTPANFCFADYFVYRRPFVAEFVTAVSQWFKLAVWSSASGPYVQSIVDHLFADRELEFVWSRGRCTQRFNSERHEHCWVKNLEKVKRRGYRLERVLVIDDSREKIAGHYGNHLLVQPFLGDLEDTELRDVLPFLEWLQSVENFRSVEKRRWREFIQAGTPTGRSAR